nr:hypothetical protein [Candidatus Gracilibacteria bacterium]
MNSRIYVKVVFLLCFLFIAHLFLYYFSVSYKSFFKGIKYEDNIVNTGSLSNTGNVIKVISTYTGSNTNNEEDNKLQEEKVQNNDLIKSDEKIVFTGDTDKMPISKEEQEVLDLFKDYKLVKLEVHSSLFDLTTEYPDPYIEYFNEEKGITLYIFQTKLYDDVLNIFDVISYNLPFKIKKVNNFGDSSFYINMDSTISDEYIRFVFSYKKKVFGLKIKKDSYNEVKEILNNLTK